MVLAYMFHFKPGDLWDMSEKDLIYWLDRAKEAREFFGGKQ